MSHQCQNTLNFMQLELSLLGPLYRLSAMESGCSRSNLSEYKSEQFAICYKFKVLISSLWNQPPRHSTGFLFTNLLVTVRLPIMIWQGCQQKAELIMQKKIFIYFIIWLYNTSILVQCWQCWSCMQSHASAPHYHILDCSMRFYTLLTGSFGDRFVIKHGGVITKLIYTELLPTQLTN